MADESAPPPTSTVDKGGNEISVTEVGPSLESDEASVATAINHVASSNPVDDETSEVPSIPDSESLSSPIISDWADWERELVGNPETDVARTRKKQRRPTPLDFGLLLEAGTSGEAYQAGPLTKATDSNPVAPRLPTVAEEPSSMGTPVAPAGPGSQQPAPQALQDPSPQVPQDQVSDGVSDALPPNDEAPDGQTDGTSGGRTNASSANRRKNLWTRLLQWLRDMQLRLPDRNNFRPIPARERAMVANQRTEYARFLPARRLGEFENVYRQRRRSERRTMSFDHALQLREFRAGNREVAQPAAQNGDQTIGNQVAGNAPPEGAGPADSGPPESKKTAVAAAEEMGALQPSPQPRPNTLLSSVKATCERVKDSFGRVKASFRRK